MSKKDRRQNKERQQRNARVVPGHGGWCPVCLRGDKVRRRRADPLAIYREIREQLSSGAHVSPLSILRES